MTQTKRKLKPGALSWALYDWANSAFTLCIITAFFPVFFTKYYSIGQAPAEVTFRFGLIVSISSLLVFIAAPFLGALAQSGSGRKRFLAKLVFLGSATTAALFLVPEGGWLAAGALYLVASFSFYSANLFYDSLLTEVSDEEDAHWVSGLGFSLGYLGSVLLFIVLYLFILQAGSLGLDASTATRISFVVVAAWWVLFTLPLLLHLKERPGSGDRPSPFHQLKLTGRQILGNRTILLFLLAYWFYIDGVHTIITMASTYSTALGIPDTQLMPAIILVQVVGVPCALIFGWLGQKQGPKLMIFVGLFIYLGVTVWGFFLDGGALVLGPLAIPKVFILALLIGCAQGGVQSLSRSLYNQIIPADQTAAFFGFYNMIGKSAAILGPFVMGLVAKATGNPRIGILSVALLFLAGMVLLARVKVPRGEDSKPN